YPTGILIIIGQHGFLIKGSHDLFPTVSYLYCIESLNETFGVFKMGLSSQEKMHILLKQLALPEELVEQYFDESALEKVVVRKKEQSWHFYIHIPHVLPFSVYEMFLQKLRDSFASIARLDLYTEATGKECEAEVVVRYSQLFHSQLPALLPPQTKILAEASVIANGSIPLTATTDAEVNALKRRVEQ